MHLLNPASGPGVFEHVLHERGPVGDCGVHVSGENEVEWLGMRPGLLDVINFELDVRWLLDVKLAHVSLVPLLMQGYGTYHPLWLCGTEIVSNDLLCVSTHGFEGYIWAKYLCIRVLIAFLPVSLTSISKSKILPTNINCPNTLQAG